MVWSEYGAEYGVPCGVTSRASAMTPADSEGTTTDLPLPP